MPITTKTGDDGSTSLLYGKRVRKDNPRIEACGVLDELNSFLGLSKNLLKAKAAKKLIDKIQKELLMIGSEYKLRIYQPRQLHLISVRMATTISTQIHRRQEVLQSGRPQGFRLFQTISFSVGLALNNMFR